MENKKAIDPASIQDVAVEYLKKIGVIDSWDDTFWTCSGQNGIHNQKVVRQYGYNEKYNGESIEELQRMPRKKCPNCNSDLSLVTNISNK